MEGTIGTIKADFYDFYKAVHLSVIETPCQVAAR
jgi:hypothetical protein